MTTHLRFIHTADIHLGRPLHCGGRPPASCSQLFNQATYHALKKIVDSAIYYQVDFVLVSGDLYDAEAYSVAANKFFVSQCQRLQKHQIPLFRIGGNHDPFRRQEEPFPSPSLVTCFDSEQVEHRIFHDGQGRRKALIMGQSYRTRWESRKMVSSFTLPKKGLFTIGLLHTQLDPANNRYVPCSPADLLSMKDVHYWALGHLHQLQMVNFQKPAVVFPGTPQGLQVKEEGPRGCLLVEVEDSVPSVKFIPTSSLIFFQLEIPIDGSIGKVPRNLVDLEEMMLDAGALFLENPPPLPEAVASIDDDYPQCIEGFVVRWILKGRGPLHSILEDGEAIPYLQERLQEIFMERHPFLFTHSILLRTGNPLPQREELMKKNPLFVELEAVVHDCLHHPETQERLLKEWGEIWQGDRGELEGNPFPFVPDEKTLAAVLEKAQMRVIEELMGRREEIED